MTALLSYDAVIAALPDPDCDHPFAETTIELTRDERTVLLCFNCLGKFPLPRRCPGCMIPLKVLSIGAGMTALICAECFSETLECRL